LLIGCTNAIYAHAITKDVPISKGITRVMVRNMPKMGTEIVLGPRITEAQFHKLPDVLSHRPLSYVPKLTLWEISAFKRSLLLCMP
jgi:hypothetical protein